MNEYINKKQLAKCINKYFIRDENGKVKLPNIINDVVFNIKELVLEMQAADVQPINYGRWEETHISLCKWIPEDEKEEGYPFYMAEMKCSCCNRYNTVTFALTLNKPDFCQWCGARMDGAKND